MTPTHPTPLDYPEPNPASSSLGMSSPSSISGSNSESQTSSYLGSIPSSQSSPSSSSGECGPPCRLKDLPIFPQGTLSVAQGFVGVRHWYLDCPHHSGEDYFDAWNRVHKKLRQICDSHWPGWPDCVPVSIQFGSPDDKVGVYGNIENINDAFPTFDQYRIVAQYQLLHISDPWPMTGKPAHPKGSVLALQIRGAGEVLQIDPLGVVSPGGKIEGGGVRSGCVTGKSPQTTDTFNSRIYIPMTEYHLVCDRLTDDQLCGIMAARPWRDREGTVNSEIHDPRNQQMGFLAEDEGTLLFDSWTLDQTFAPDIDNPRRWRLTCVLKCRQIPLAKGPYPENCSAFKYPVGWNHDYKLASGDPSDTGLAWRFIMMKDKHASGRIRWTPHGKCPEGLVPRYPYDEFTDLFCSDNQPCAEAQNPARSCGARHWIAERDTMGIGADDIDSGSLPEAVARIVDDARGVGRRKAVREAMLALSESESSS